MKLLTKLLIDIAVRRTKSNHADGHPHWLVVSPGVFELLKKDPLLFERDNVVQPYLHTSSQGNDEIPWVRFYKASK